MSEIPPKHTPDSAAGAAPGQETGVVAMYNAASHSGAEPFPVLKAFQDYIEAERAQARKRVVQLSIIFGVVIALVVIGFFIVGISMFNNMSALQAKLLDAALAKTQQAAPQPVVVQPAPAPAPVPPPQPAAALPPEVTKKLESLSALASNVHTLASAKDSELAALRNQMQTMQQQNEQLKKEMTKQKEQVAKQAASGRPVMPPGVGPLLPPIRPAQAPVAKVPSPETYAKQTAANAPAPQQVAPKAAVPQAHVAVAAAKPAPSKATSTNAVASFTDPLFPPATKDAPVAPNGVKPPALPAGMMSTAIPLKTKNMGAIPWRVLIPE